MICQRPAHKSNALLWEFAGGKVEPGETKEAALIRECQEELGITLSVGAPYFEVTHQYPDILVHLTLFHATIAEGEPQLLEHHDLRWITPADTVMFPFCPADTDILAQIRKDGNSMNLSPYFQSLVDTDPAPIVICDLEDTVLYMNDAAIQRYSGSLVGLSLRCCHNDASNHKIDRVKAWFAEDPTHNTAFTLHNSVENKDVYMVALRDGDTLIGYYERHAYRNPEMGTPYEGVML